MIEYLEFHPVKKSGSLIGFVSFKYNNQFSFNEIAVHKLLKPKDRLKVRLVYPENKDGQNYYNPINVKTQIEIDTDISAYIAANYPKAIK